MEGHRGIRFREENGDLIGQKNGLRFFIYRCPGVDVECMPAYYVSVFEGEKRRISTSGHRYFSREEEAKEFCRQIACGEIDMEALARELEAENEPLEQESFNKVLTEKIPNDGVCRDFTVWLGERGPGGKALRGVEKVVLPTVTTHDGYQDCPMVAELVFDRIEDAAELINRMGQQCKLEIRAAVQDWDHPNAEWEINSHTVPSPVASAPL